MKTHTSDFKDNIKLFGRELDSKITYTIGGVTTELGNENLNSVTPHYKGSILKSVMKQLDIDSNVEIPTGTQINYQFGIKVNGSYEYLNFGNYIVYKVEKQEDKNSYIITCYDKMLYAMKDYVSFATYPTTIRSYISSLCSHLGITFANTNDTFANYDKTITQELFLSSDGSTLGYTFRDVLDQLSQVTASTICINSNDELEIRYINDTNDTIDEEYLKDINVKFGEQYGAINTIVLTRSGGSDSIHYPAILPQNPIEIKIEDNQFMNFNDRDTYLPDIYNKLNGLSFYINDYSSTGICYYELCDRYNVSIGENIYSCVMFNDEIQVTQGLIENIHTEMPNESVTDYKKSDTTDRRINQAYIIVDKQNQQIQSVVQQVSTIAGGYVLTTDTTYQDGITYYKLENDDYVELIAGTDYEIGDPIIGDVYIFEEDLKSQIDNINDTLNGTDDTEGILGILQNVKNELQEVQSTMLTQTSEAFVMSFVQRYINTAFDEVNTLVQTNNRIITEQLSYINFTANGIEIGKADSEIKLLLQSDKIIFLTGDTDLSHPKAYISSNQLYIEDSTIVNKIRLANWEMKENDAHNLNIRWVGGVI